MISVDLNDVFAYLARCIVALGPYQKDVVLSGGLVPVAYRSVLPGISTRLTPLMTFDLDFTVPPLLKDRGTNLHERLQVDFEALRTGSGKLPVTKYYPKDLGADSPIYIEFITPRKGSMRTRWGTNQGVLEVQSSLHAQTDPYVGMLLLEAQQFVASKIPQLGLNDEHKLLLPHPMCFVLQKALIRGNRSSDRKRDNDACHIYDVAMISRSMWPEMKSLAVRLSSEYKLPRTWITRAFETLGAIFETAESPGTIAAVANYSTATSPAEVTAAVRAFLRATKPS